jgi:hypothetical protein
MIPASKVEFLYKKTRSHGTTTSSKMSVAAREPDEVDYAIVFAMPMSTLE